MNQEELTDQVKQVLGNIVDPETGLSIMRMDLIHQLRVSADGVVSLVFRPSSPVCPMAYSLANTIKKNLEATEGVSSVRIAVQNFHRADHLESLLNLSARKET